MFKFEISYKNVADQLARDCSCEKIEEFFNKFVKNLNAIDPDIDSDSAFREVLKNELPALLETAIYKKTLIKNTVENELGDSLTNPLYSNHFEFLVRDQEITDKLSKISSVTDFVSNLRSSLLKRDFYNPADKIFFTCLINGLESSVIEARNQMTEYINTHISSVPDLPKDALKETSVIFEKIDETTTAVEKQIETLLNKSWEQTGK